MTLVSNARRSEILYALRTGTVPERGLDVLAVGLDPFAEALDRELREVKRGQARFKALRGEYGCGKTFAARWLQERALRQGFATSEVQISETETPLHRLETVYRRMMERLSTPASRGGAFSDIVRTWFSSLEREVLSDGAIDEADDEAIEEAVAALMESRLSTISESAPQFAAALRAYQRAEFAGDLATAQGLLAWLAGQPNVGAGVKRTAGVKGDLDHYGALAFLRGLLVVLRDAGYAGLVFVLDEVETLQRVRSDVREKSLNALRMLADEAAAGTFSGLYLMITGTPAFFDGPQGVQRAPALASRLHTEFDESGQFDNPRAPQIRLRGFDLDRLTEVGVKVRDLYAEGSSAAGRVRDLCDDDYVRDLARAVGGNFGEAVHVAPRVFLKKLVDVLDRVEQFERFDPRVDYSVRVTESELTEAERGALSVDEVEIDV